MEDNIKEAIYEELMGGVSNKEVAAKYDTYPAAITRLFTKEERAGITAAKKAKSAIKAKEKKREATILLRKYIKIDEPVLTVSEVHNRAFDFATAGKYDLWFYSNDKGSIGKNLMKVQDDPVLGLRGYASQNIPYIECNPAKRIHQVTHSLFTNEDKMLDTERMDYDLKTNFVDILNPDEPLIWVKRHDVTTLNAKIGFPTTDNDRALTQEDGCIVSEDFAKRFVYQFLKKKINFIREDNDKPDKFTVEANEELSNIDSTMLKLSTRIKHSGEVTIRTKKKVKGKWFYRGVEHITRSLQIGDKLRSLSGLKIVVSEIRPGLNCDILIHPKQILSKGKAKDIKGSAIMEMRETGGYVMVGMRKDEVYGENEKLAYTTKLSVNLYPVLKIFAPGTLEAVVKDNTVFMDYLRVMHLFFNLDTRRVEVTTPDKERGKGYVDLLHYEWRIAQAREKYKLAISPDLTQKDYEYAMFTEERWEGVKMNHIIWDKLYIPEFLGDGYWHKSDWREWLWVDMENKPFEGAKNPWLVSQQKTKKQAFMGESPSSPMGNFLKDKGIFPQIKTGKYLLALPTLEEEAIMLNPALEEEVGKECVIFREPIVGKNNVYSIPVIYDEKTPLYTVRIPRKIVLAANGDYDGDHWGVIPYIAEGLRIEDHKIDIPEIDRTSINIDTVEVTERTKEQLIIEANNWYNSYKDSRDLVEDFGGLCNSTSFVCDSIEDQKRIMELHQFLEVNLKPERMTDPAFTIPYKAAINELKALKDANREPGKKTLIEVLKKATKNMLAFENLIGYVPGGFWMDIFGLPLTMADKNAEEALSTLRAEGKINLWSFSGNSKEEGN